MFWRRQEARQALQRVLDFAPDKVLIPHGEVAREHGVAFIRKGFDWLLQ